MGRRPVSPSRAPLLCRATDKDETPFALARNKPAACFRYECESGRRSRTALRPAEPRVKSGVGAGSGSLPHAPPIENGEESVMSEVIFFETSVAHQGPRIGANALRNTSGERVFVREAPSGIWIVHDE